MPTARDKASRMANAQAYPMAGPGRGPDGDELTGLLSAISEVLDEMADAEADAAYRIPCAPLSEGLAVLLHRLRQSFFVDPGNCLQEELVAADPSFADNVSRIHSERDILHTALDDILELVVWSGQPGTSWVEIEARFRCFASRVTEHVATSDGMRCEPAIARATTPK